MLTNVCCCQVHICKVRIVTSTGVRPVDYFGTKLKGYQWISEFENTQKISYVFFFSFLYMQSDVRTES